MVKCQAIGHSFPVVFPAIGFHSASTLWKRRATGTITNVGGVTNTYSIEWGTAKAANYEISEELGTLTITKATMPLTVTGHEGTYDGATYSVTVDAPTGSTIKGLMPNVCAAPIIEKAPTIIMSPWAKLSILAIP